MPDSVILGIDPGLYGAVAAIGLDGCALWAVPLPTIGRKRREIDVAALARLVRQQRVGLAVVESVASRPGQGVVGVFSFGRTLGRIEGMLATLLIPVELVTPQRWKGEVLAGTAKDKAAAIVYARKRFPTVELVPRGCRVPHHGIAEALCMAEYGQRLVVGESEGAA